MAGAPESCPTCSTKIPPGASRCPGCGRVFGEDNRCPHCHAIAAVKPRGEGFVCVACGKPREHLPETTVLGDVDARASRTSLVPGAPGVPASRGASSFLRLFGVMGIGGGVLGAALATIALGTTPIGIAVAIAVALTGVAVGASALRRATGRDAARAERERKGLEARIVTLAEKHRGDLTVAVVAEALRIDEKEADVLLTRMADGSRVSLEVDESVGTVHYVFHDVQSQLPPTRVAPDDGAGAEETADEAEAEKARRL